MLALFLKESKKKKKKLRKTGKKVRGISALKTSNFNEDPQSHYPCSHVRTGRTSKYFPHITTKPGSSWTSKPSLSLAEWLYLQRAGFRKALRKATWNRELGSQGAGRSCRGAGRRNWSTQSPRQGPWGPLKYPNEQSRKHSFIFQGRATRAHSPLPVAPLLTQSQSQTQAEAPGGRPGPRTQEHRDSLRNLGPVWGWAMHSSGISSPA